MPTVPPQHFRRLVLKERGGLLQRREYHVPTGVHEWYTVVPLGVWRTTEFQGVTRRLSLRRYVVLVYHCPPTGAHRGRDGTIAAILALFLILPCA